jgi:hypothetical protein
MYSYNVNKINRNNGGSAAKSITYVCRTKMQKYLTDVVYDYMKELDLLHYEMILPEKSPVKLYNFQTFCDEVEKAERRTDSRLFRSVRIALPNEEIFTLEDQIENVRSYVKNIFVSKGMGAVFAIHNGKCPEEPSKNNIHSHILLTTRGIDEKGFFRLKNPEWDKKSELLMWRKTWENTLNKAYKDKGLDKRISCESYEVQGLLKEKIAPTWHRGYAVHEMENRGIRTKIGDYNRDIIMKREEKELIRQKEREQSRDRGRGY